jgi:ribosomal protein S18 acetylase RimI-like enzyme
MIKIEAMSPADLDLLEPLADEFVRSHGELSFRSDYWSACRDWIKGLCAESRIVIYSARDASGLVGAAVATIQDNGPLLDPEKIGYVAMFVVLPQYRRQGIGESLWDALRGWFVSKGVTEVQLYTHPGNGAAQSFWEHYGFDVMLERRARKID